MMNGISKRIGSTLKWLWLPVVVYTTTLSVEARLIQTGATESTWETWRCFLILSLLILSFITYFLNTSSRDAAVEAVCSTAAPWGLYLLATLLYAFFRWEFVLLPVPCFELALMMTYTMPALFWFIEWDERNR
ncbi:hypothetical protein [Kosakonia sacchari]|uniref:Uncharacterized protein n=1 Tax=Kosakonia sacchari TaxID=1158459 RepID=A0ABZ0MY67_9ENTR|nr:hypothetical protein [Kosakonia sacchari]WOZ79938.1 hypothetical protein Q8Y70_24150 [Kosakonia sacchari]